MIHVVRETHEAPEAVVRRLERAGGLNRFGEPNYRAVWGWNRLTWIGGKWEDRDAHGVLLRERVELRKVPKYHQLDRWHIERWCPPELYGSPEEWRARTLEIEDTQNVAALGPYPSRGEYELAFTLEGPQGEFVQLTPTVAENVARVIEFCRAVPRARRRSALQSRETRSDRAFEVLADAVLSA